MMRLIPLVLACAVTGAACAQPVYKCSADGTTSYTDRPCARGPSAVLPPSPAGVDAAAGTVRGGDARILLELEKLRAEREKRALALAREARLSSHSAAVQRKRCAQLHLRARWADEDVARLHGNAQDRARVRARRQRETLASECPG